MRFPLAHNIIRRNSESHTFGMVRKYPDGSPKPHQGHDYYAAPGTPCFAVADGKVASIGSGGDYGATLTIDIGGGRWAFYAHLQAVEVTMGEAVSEGQRVGLTGKSGNAEGLAAADMHLHFEARTAKAPGKGLGGRVSPTEWFGSCPLKVAVVVP